jgi:hypothetical protein
VTHCSESDVLRFVNNGRALRGGEPLAALPSSHEQPSTDDLALIDMLGREMKGAPGAAKVATRAGWHRTHKSPSGPQEERDAPQELEPSGRDRDPLRGSSEGPPLGDLSVGAALERVVPLGGEHLKSLDRNPRMVEVALGRAVVIGELIPCVLPDHHDEADVFLRGDGRFGYRCRCDSFERNLTEVYVGRVTGDGRHRSSQEFILWRLRHAIKAEIVPKPPPVRVPQLCGTAARAAFSCHSGLVLFLRIRQLTAQCNEPEFAFARRFAADWCGIKSNQAKDGIEGLIRAGVLVMTGKIRTHGNRETNMYRLGDGVLRHPSMARREAP